MAAGSGGMSWPRPRRLLLALMVANVVAYVAELILIRANLGVVEALMLTPADVFEAGRIWQPFTYLWLHDPEQPTHLLFNMLWLYLFGSQLEPWWGERRFLTGYLLFGLGGGVLTLLVALLSRVSPFDALLGSFWIRPHLGASGAVMGVLIGWGMAFSKKEMNFFLLGRMTGRTFVAVVVAVELLMALSLSSVSSTSHFGGMITAFIVCGGWWKPARWSTAFRRRRLLKEKARLEAELSTLHTDPRGGPPPNTDASPGSKPGPRPDGGGGPGRWPNNEDGGASGSGSRGGHNDWN
ncbi:MAG: rhomboid family intramembrane serine protease [Deltaproteobacteria bacterium]|nr:rhomboid family intramembrane serine protease [Deltaproteobacteria bacterium]